MLRRLKKYFGPSTLITAAFIGPGTVTVCTMVGVSHGYTLLWAVAFSALSTLILQEMSARLSLITGKDLGEVIRVHLKHPGLRWMISVIVVSAILIGNAAYEGGNISGAALGLRAFGPDINASINGVKTDLTAFLCALVVLSLLISGRIRFIEHVLTGLVILMSILFLITAVIVKPDISELLTGLFVPQWEGADLMMVIALIGTTVVPYNLFLHASVIRRKYNSPAQLTDLRKENLTAIVLGGLISVCIVITSAAVQGDTGGVSNLTEMARQLEPVLGLRATKFMGLGLFAAGLTSAVTAPLAAAYTARGLFGLNGDETNPVFRIIWILIVLTGTAVAMFSLQPILVIQFAQITNGILLPVTAVLLLYLINQPSLMGEYRNSLFRNMISVLVIGICILIGIRSLNQVMQWL